MAATRMDKPTLLAVGVGGGGEGEANSRLSKPSLRTHSGRIGFESVSKQTAVHVRLS